MSGITLSSCDPNVIDDVLIRDSILKLPLNVPFDLISDDVDFDKTAIMQLRLEFKSIIKISNLDKFINLTKLHLSNNLIDKIEGLSSITQLLWLDLSFNLIKKIENLDTLVNLKDLCLSHNKIQEIECLDKLNSLQSLTLCFNRITDLRSISGLRSFSCLKSLGLVGNPIVTDPNYLFFTISHLPQLLYCDFTIISPALKAEATKRYEIEIQLLEDSSKEILYRKMFYDELQLQRLSEDSAFINGLNGTEFLTEILSDDNHSFNLLHGVDEVFTIFKEDILAVCKSCSAFALRAKENRENEIELFNQCFDNLILTNDKIASQKNLEFQNHRCNIESLLVNDCDDNIFREKISLIRSKLSSLNSFLLKNEMDVVDQLDAIIQEFERNFREMFTIFIEGIHVFFSNLREIAMCYFEKLNEIGHLSFEQFSKNQLEFDPPDELLRLLMDKDSLLANITSSHDSHMSKIDNKEDIISTSSSVFLKNLIDKTLKVENKRGRLKIAEINNFIDSQYLILRDLEDHAIFS